MTPKQKSFRTLAGLLLAGGATAIFAQSGARSLGEVMEDPGHYRLVEIQHPIAGAVFPLNFPAPAVSWKTNDADGKTWVTGFKAGGRAWWFERTAPLWRPSAEVWRQVKASADGGAIEVVVGAVDPERRRLEARGSVRFTLARETVDYPLFYREVNLPFVDAVKDPSRIRWRFGAIDREETPPIVLEKLPVCGNCHSFDRKGEFLAMDVDYANNKASYVITRTGPEMRLTTSDLITWDDYRREDGQETFGLLSQISPDGRYVLSTVKDQSVFVPRPGLAFSQLFFPIKGILAVYDRPAKRFSSLPGADDPAFVQSNPAWSPDGQWVVFARNRAARLEKRRNKDTVLLAPEECLEFLEGGKEFKFDLYRVAFNGGKGGKAEPVRGASANGRSNFFPKFSPDGRWIVFCQASNYMLLQPDSQLYIIPAGGGEARRLSCNLGRMNSWHTWSPDGRWLVFSSKADSDYTQLYLARIDERGEASQPVWLQHMVGPERAANIPEFVALAPNAIGKIHEQFLDDYSFVRAGNDLFQGRQPDLAIESFKRALALNPNNAMAHQRLGFLLYHVKQLPQEGLSHTRTALRLDAQNPFAQFDLGSALLAGGDPTNAVGHLAEAVRLLPNGDDQLYNAAELHFTLAMAQYRLGLWEPCAGSLRTLLCLAPDHARANYFMALARARLGETQTAVPFFDKASYFDARLGRSPDFYDVLSANYIQQGSYAEGLKAAEKGRRLAARAGLTRKAAELQQRVEHCKGLLAPGNRQDGARP
ncbi:MAG: tetratricopeptide repeat protein [Limisphaerales bacterium]